MKWEDKCKQCGLCCHHKVYVNGNSGPVAYTGTACKYLDTKTMRCKVYRKRKQINPACIKLTEEVVNTVDWLPESCGYKCK